MALGIEMKLRRILKGYRPLVVRRDGLLISRGYKIYWTDHELSHFSLVGEIEAGYLRRIAVRIQVLQRIFRLGIHSAISVSDSEYLIVERKRIWHLNTSTGEVHIDYEIERGNQPLKLFSLQDVSGFADGVYFGEYWENKPREPVRILHRTSQGQWDVVFTFQKGFIEHIHAIISDPTKEFVWLLTGDFGQAAGMWAARKGFSEVTPVRIGSQEYRSTWMYFFEEKSYYATDSQLEPNFFMRLELVNGSVEAVPLFSLPGSSIYSFTAGENLAFSTTVEPCERTGNFVRDIFNRTRGPGITSDRSYLYYGNPAKGFLELFSAKKDFLPYMLFQFGTITFPENIDGPCDRLYCYCIALAGYDDRLLQFRP